MTKLLAFDTATEACTAAISIGDEILERFELAPRRHAELILPMISELLAEAGCKLSEMDAIAFGCGPGAFMGVRIAVGMAQGLAFAVDRPVIPISTLQGLAQTGYDLYRCENIVAAWDARMGELYWGAYQANQENLVSAFLSEKLSAPKDLEMILPQKHHWTALGNAWAAYQSLLPKGILDQFSTIHSDIFPHASALIKLAKCRYAKGEFLDAKQALPVYLRDNVVA